jgi:plasmid stabilization system protein ParE
MNWRVSIRPKAKADLVRARDWYEDRCSGLGDELLVAVAETLVRLEAAPEQFPFYYRGFRRALTRRFPYKLFFRIKGDSVIVCRILHGSQDHQEKLGTE